MNHRGLAAICIFCCCILFSCLDPYSPPSSNEDANFLVIDGQINSTDSMVIVKLSRAIKLNDQSSFPKETDALVTIETESGYFATLNSIEPGVYSSKKFFSKENQYRLKVVVGNREYFSELISLQNNTPIDSLNWRAFDDQFDIYVNSHDFSDGPKYYRYSYVETYQYTSNFYSSWVLNNGVAVARPNGDDIYNCWTTKPSTNIILATTESFSENIISNQIIFHTARGDRRLWRKISLLVTQTALSKEAYEYWSQIKKMSESLGGLFDPLPYSIKGNITSVNNPEEIVLGYFSGGDVSRRRIVIPNNQLPQNYSGVLLNDCIEQYIDAGSVGSLQGQGYLLTRAEYMGGIILVGYFYSYPRCVDCQLEGGSTIEPDFMK